MLDERYIVRSVDEQKRILNKVRAGAAFGGGELSDLMESELRRVMCGEKTPAEVRSDILKRHSV